MSYCQDLEAAEQIVALVRNELDGGERIAAESHLRECESCRSIAGILSAEISDYDDYAVPPAPTETLVHLLDRQAGLRAERTRSNWFGMVGRYAPLMAGVAALFIAGIFVGQSGGPGGDFHETRIGPAAFDTLACGDTLLRAHSSWVPGVGSDLPAE